MKLRHMSYDFKCCLRIFFSSRVDDDDDDRVYIIVESPVPPKFIHSLIQCHS